MKRPYSVTVPGAIERYGFGKTKLYELISSGRIEARKVGTRTVIICESVEEYLDQAPRANEAAP
jgi:excisionase family DNA binding protein